MPPLKLIMTKPNYQKTFASQIQPPHAEDNDDITEQSRSCMGLVWEKFESCRIVTRSVWPFIFLCETVFSFNVILCQIKTPFSRVSDVCLLGCTKKVLK